MAYTYRHIFMPYNNSRELVRLLQVSIKDFLTFLTTVFPVKAQVSIAGYSLKSTGSIFIILPLPRKLFLVHYGVTPLHKAVFTKKCAAEGSQIK